MSKKIFGVPWIINQMVNEKVNDSNDEVIQIVLGRLAVKTQQSEFRKENGINEDWHKYHQIVGPHDRGCGCIYCTIFHRYVSTKMSAHRLRRRIDAYDYMCRPYDGPVDFKHLNSLEKEWRTLKAQKDQLKKLAGL